MPIIIPENLPANKILKSENIFVMSYKRSVRQDIRPLEILILNLMPTKIETETQLLRLLGNTPLQVNVTLLRVSGHKAKNTSEDHLTTFYKEFSDIEDRKFDGFIITGAPVEHLPFEEVEYWDELTRIFDYSSANVTNTLHVCWGAQAALYHHYGIGKRPLPEKKFGVFPCTIARKSRNKLLRGFDEIFLTPHSRHTTVDTAAVENEKRLTILSKTADGDVNIVISKDQSRIFVTGHLEYDRDTLNREYLRDVEKGLPIAIPLNYFKDDDPRREIPVRWRSHAHLLFSNWLNYFVYQETPYKIERI
ncbi:MAG: homoserine O-succinyltransferase [Fusobacteriaceae bacterium]|jgi:homoserine O-succinyltransferase|nr:homoserine O-succinyltransferase [Fusobacteriaceae bacterium]